MLYILKETTCMTLLGNKHYVLFPLILRSKCYSITLSVRLPTVFYCCIISLLIKIVRSKLMIYSIQEKTIVSAALCMILSKGRNRKHAQHSVTGGGQEIISLAGPSSAWHKWLLLLQPTLNDVLRTIFHLYSFLKDLKILFWYEKNEVRKFFVMCFICILKKHCKNSTWNRKINMVKNTYWNTGWGWPYLLLAV